jgi:uncharacterized protein
VAMRPPIPNITLSRRARIALWTVGVLVVLIVALVKFTGVYINWLWFGSVGFHDVYTTVFWTRVVLFFTFGLLMALIIGGNLVIAYVLSPPFRPMSPEQQNIERYRSVLEPRRILVLLAVTLIALFAAGLSAQGNWAAWQLWLHGGSFGIRDPQFNLDVSFYAWDYPVYRLMLGFGFTAIIFAFILSVLVHYLTGAIRLQTPGPKVTLAARRHLTILAFVFIVLKAIAYWLDRYGLVFSDRSKFTGASYTDVHAVLPARTILFWIAIVIAAGLIASLWLRSTLLPGIAFVSMLVLSILISGIYPAILQQVSVKPNASTKEAPYIERNLNATRDAYGISDANVKYVPYTSKKVEPSAVLASNPTLDNIRILDPNVVSPDFLKVQQGGANVYGFAPKLDVDRYDVGGTESDYMVGVRELDAANFNNNQTNWINEHTTYTHGYGFVAAAADKDITGEGTVASDFAAGSIPPQAAAPSLTLKNPAVYYGELMPTYSIVGASGAPQEFNGNGDKKVTYAGSGGVSLSNVFTRLAFAVNYKQTNFLLNDAASANGAKIIFNRDPRQAVQKVAPFLKVDGDPYPFVDQTTGDIVWMVDGYTTMNDFPYSQRQSLLSLTNDSLAANNKTAKQPNDEINYIRNSVKATVDAYTGKVTLYAWDENDPVLKAWESVFPGVVTPKDKMPASVRDHVRYPEDLFKVQRALLGSYHVTDPVQFYNDANRWTVPNDPTDSSDEVSQPPYYVLAADPNNPAQAQFQLTSPMNVNAQSYLAAYISVDSDPNGYGQFTVLQLPRGSQAVRAPEQVYSQITADPTISRDSLYNTGSGSSSVIHGNLLTLPLDNSFMYVEPLYRQSSTASGGALPVLARVIVVYGGKTGYGATLQNALSDFLPGHSTGQTVPGLSSGGTTTTPPTTTPTTSPSSSSAPSTGASSSGANNTTPPDAQLAQAYQALDAAIRANDHAAEAAALARINELVSQHLTSSPSPSR